MDPNILCSEDDSNTAVCVCFCRFPFPALCEAHLPKHRMDTEGFLHFHLPVRASQCLTSKEMRNEYTPWLFSLHYAHSVLKQNEDDIVRFEEQIEATRLEVLHQFEAYVEQSKRRVSSLREAFNAELLRARIETSQHALEQWTPEEGSLSALIWNNTPEKLFRLLAKKGSLPLSQMLEVHIETQIRSFAQYNQQPELSGEQQCKAELDRYRNELSELRKEIEVLRAENAALKAENATLKADYSVAIEDIAQLKAVCGESAPLQRQDENSYENTVRKTIPVCLKKAAADKHAFLYKESASSLQEVWELLQKCSIHDSQTVAVGSLLAEVLGLHLARAEDSLRIIEICLQIQSTNAANSEETLILRSLKTTICFLDGRDDIVEAVCRETLQSFTGSANHYWIALFFLARTLHRDEEKTLIETGLTKSFRDENDLTQLIRMSLRGQLARMDGNYEEAEKIRKEAQKLANYGLSTTIYAVLNLFDLGRVYHHFMERKELAIDQFTKARSIADTHYPASRIAGRILDSLATVYYEQEQREEELNMRLEAQTSWERDFPSGAATAANLKDIANLYRDMKQLETALQKREEAQRFFEAHRPAHLDRASNLIAMADLHLEMKQPEDALRKREEAHRFLSVHYPTHLDLGRNLTAIADVYLEMEQTDAALQKRLDAQKFFAAHHPTHLHQFYNLIAIADAYLKTKQPEAALQKREEAHAFLQAHHATQVHLATNLAAIADIYLEMEQTDAALQKRADAQKFLEAHHAAHLSLFHNLTAMADLYVKMKQPEVALQKREEAQSFLEAHYPTQVDGARNLNAMADVYLEMKQSDAALQKRREAHMFLEMHFGTDTRTADSLAELAKLYVALGRVEEAEQACLDCQSHWMTHNPTNTQAAWSLCDLGELCEGMGKTDSAIVCVQSALEVATAQKSNYCQRKAQELLTRLKNQRGFLAWISDLL